MRAAALLVASLLLLAAGCLHGDGAAVSREDYVARADAVCGDYQIRLSRIPPPVTGDPAALAAYLERALPIARAQLDELRDLPLPDDTEDRRLVERLLDLLEEELRLNEAARDAADEGDQVAAQTGLGQAAALSAEAGRIAEQFDFVVCARR